MALAASDIYVRAGQFENGCAVVKSGWLPRGGGVTKAAIRAKLPLMGIVFQMAVTAIRRRALEYLVLMALAALGVEVCPGQLES